MYDTIVWACKDVQYSKRFVRTETNHAVHASLLSFLVSYHSYMPIHTHTYVVRQTNP